MHSIKMIAGTMVATASLCIPSAWAASPVVFSGSGADAATALDAYRTAIGGAKNTGGPEASGRREINWDGGGSPATSLVAGSIRTNTPTGWRASGRPSPRRTPATS